MSYLKAKTPGEIIARRRSELSMTQAELAVKLGFKMANFISILESDRSRVPFERATEFADALDIDRVWFIERLMRERFPAVAEELFDRHKVGEKAA